MLIRIVQRGFVASSLRELALEYPVLIIEPDNWNDFGYLTTCRVHFYRARSSDYLYLGLTRIMRKAQEVGQWTFEGLVEFKPRLPLSYGSISVDHNYYDRILSLGRVVAANILSALRDAAFNPAVWKRLEDDACFKDSLLRETSSALRIRDSVPRLFGRHLRRTKSFRFFFEVGDQHAETQARFNFRRERQLPHRIALIVGSNGAGKTQLLSKLAIALTGATSGSEDVDYTEAKRKRSESGRVVPLPSFYSVIAVSYNAFDNFEIPSLGEQTRYAYRYCGLRKEDGTLKTPEDIHNSLLHTFWGMDADRRSEFNSIVERLIPGADRMNGVPLNLSAGQKIVLSILADLVAHVQRYSLILMDEPETHLHPTLTVSLLSEFSALLERRDCFAIVATHSPLIAQQIPRHKISIISRESGVTAIRLPRQETFGSGLSDLASELFDASEYRRDYTAILDALLRLKDNDPKRVEMLFEGRLDPNALMYLWSASERNDD